VTHSLGVTTVGLLLLASADLRAATEPPAGTPTETLASDACLDQAELSAGVRKGVQKRDFTKRLRVEASLFGGFFASDLLSSSYDWGGAIAFFPAEDVGVEVSLLVSPFDLAIERPLTNFFAGQIFRPSLAYIAVSDLVWAPVHLKVRASERAILHGDVLVYLGAGETFHSTVQGLTFDGGVGLKLYPTRYLAIRVDLRDYVMIQEAVSVQRTTNNLVGLVGLSLFLPGPR
jgi:outer membrane beta-barrel protein